MIRQYGCFELMHFLKKSSPLSSAGLKILAFGSHCSVNFQPILDCFIPSFKLKYDNLKNVKTIRVNSVRCQLTSNQTEEPFLGYQSFSHLDCLFQLWTGGGGGSPVTVYQAACYSAARISIRLKSIVDEEQTNMNMMWMFQRFFIRQQFSYHIARLRTLNLL